MTRLDGMIISENRGVYTERHYYAGVVRYGYTPGMYSRGRIESLINSGQYKINVQIRLSGKMPSPFVIITRK